jgi:DNA-binding XRE family transcriptional regulator
MPKDDTIPALTRTASEILHERYVQGDPGRLAQLDEHHTHFAVAQAVCDLRSELGLTQRELAAQVGATEEEIAALEDADYGGPVLPLLRRIAEAVGRDLRISFAGGSHDHDDSTVGARTPTA